MKEECVEVELSKEGVFCRCDGLLALIRLPLGWGGFGHPYLVGILLDL